MPRKDARNRAAYLLARKNQRRTNGICIDCPERSPTYHRCDECRRIIGIKRRKLKAEP